MLCNCIKKKQQILQDYIYYVIAGRIFYVLKSLTRTTSRSRTMVLLIAKNCFVDKDHATEKNRTSRLKDTGRSNISKRSPHVFGDGSRFKLTCLAMAVGLNSRVWRWQSV